MPLVNTPVRSVGSFCSSSVVSACFRRRASTGIEVSSLCSAITTLYTGGFSGFIASTAAPIATGWSEPVPWVGFAPTVDQRLFTAHE